jgi:hypothetical protein
MEILALGTHNAVVENVSALEERESVRRQNSMRPQTEILHPVSRPICSQLSAQVRV